MKKVLRRIFRPKKVGEKYKYEASHYARFHMHFSAVHATFLVNIILLNLIILIIFCEKCKL
jgi:hypothetical protein